MTAVINWQTLPRSHTQTAINAVGRSNVAAARDTSRTSPFTRLLGGGAAAANASSICSANIRKVRTFLNSTCFLKPYILFTAFHLAGKPPSHAGGLSFNADQVRPLWSRAPCSTGSWRPPLDDAAHYQIRQLMPLTEMQILYLTAGTPGSKKHLNVP